MKLMNKEDFYLSNMFSLEEYSWDGPSLNSIENVMCRELKVYSRSRKNGTQTAKASQFHHVRSSER